MLFNMAEKGSGGGANIASASTRSSLDNVLEITFTGLLGEPKAFILQQSQRFYFKSNATSKTVVIVWDGTNYYVTDGNLQSSSSTGRLGFHLNPTNTFATYEGGELRVKSNVAFGRLKYDLVYIY